MPLSEIILITMGLLTVAMMAAGLCRNLPIPYTVLLVILGIAMGETARHGQPLEALAHFSLTPELVLFLFLPALIFESAFNLDARQMLKDLAPILTLAIPALLLSTALIGAGLWLLLDMGLILALLFGALISATDPVAVIALFKELGAPQRLTILVEGESLLNDATAIVVFHILIGVLLAGGVAWSDLGGALADFLRVFLGGVLCGVVVGAVLSELLYRLRLGLSAYLIISIILAYAGFVLAEHVLHVSGVMSVVAGAVTLGVLGVSRVPQVQTEMVRETWEMIALVCNSLLFLLVGLSVNLARLGERIDVIAVAVLLVLLARAATVYTMVPATVRLFRLPRVSMGERHIMWWGGLKGGLAIAIVLSIPTGVAGRDLLLDLTLGVVMVSLLVNASTIRPLIHWLGIDRLSGDEQADLRHGLMGADDTAAAVLQRFRERGLLSRSTLQQVQMRCDEALTTELPALDDRQDVRHLYIRVLRAEMEELQQLHEMGLIRHYIYMDIKNTLYLDRERHLAGGRAVIGGDDKAAPSLFVRLENTLVQRLREHDWAAGLLARYQYLRFNQSLQRDMAGIMMAAAALEAIDADAEHDEVQKRELRRVYHARLERRRRRLQTVATEFPDFYRRFERRLFTRVALLSARARAGEAFHHGEIGAKVYTRIERRINEQLAALPGIGNPAPRPRPEDLIASVPLLGGLSRPVLERLARNATGVTFLPGDVVIGEGEHGDALYILTHGVVRVRRRGETVAELRDGDFFGEMALLGDQVRTATVEAETACTLLRLTRRQVLELAESEAELRSRLEQVQAERLAT
jgi:CPA1 family monovalent cation:H+ antiporter